MLEFTQSSASRETKSPLLMVMSDVAAQPVSGRKCHRLSSSTDPSLTMGFILGPPQEFSSRLAAIQSLKPSRCSPRRTHLLMRNGTLRSVSPVWWGEEGLRLGRSSWSCSAAASSEDDTTRTELTHSDVPSSEGLTRCIIPACLETPDPLWFCSRVKAPFLPRQ